MRLTPSIWQTPTLSASQSHSARGSPQGLPQADVGKRLWHRGCAGSGPLEAARLGVNCAYSGFKSIDSWEAEDQGRKLSLKCGLLGPQSPVCQGPRLQQHNGIFHCTSLGPVVPLRSAQSSRGPRSHPQRPQLPVPSVFALNSLRQLLCSLGM